MKKPRFPRGNYEFEVAEKDGPRRYTMIAKNPGQAWLNFLGLAFQSREKPVRQDWIIQKQ